MLSSEIKRHITKVPFVPFSIVMADGRKIPVVARDFILVSPTGRLVDIYQPDDEHDIVDTLLITGLSFEKLSPLNTPVESSHK